MINLNFEDCVISFPETVKHELFDDGYCYGIRFLNDNSCHEVLHNREVNWSRIIWSSKNYHSSDMPFNESTCKLLPTGVIVRKIMNKDESKYLELLKEILETGTEREDRTGIGTIGIFGTKLRFSLKNNTVPMLTTKKMFSKGIIEELLFFLRGDTDTKKLEAKGVNIWKGNTSREFLDSKGLNHLPEGSLGKGYGYQWRRFGSIHVEDQWKKFDTGTVNGSYLVKAHNTPGIDQVKQVLETLKTNPNDRRMIISAWNPLQLKEMALPPCHMMVQFYVTNGELSAQWYQRSVDSFLGLPFNILSYAVLTRIMAQAAGLKAKEVIFIGGDTHIYSNHVEQVKEQISRKPFDFPKMKINKELSTIEDIENLDLKDFEFNGYESYPSIKAEMAV